MTAVFRIGVLLAFAAGCAASEDLAVFPREQAGTMLGDHLKREALAALDARDAVYAQVRTPEEFQNWQRSRREHFLAAIGPFPERTPLNARVAGRRDFDDYRIEKVIFESQPGFHVTATLYLPRGSGPHPAVLHPTGHSEAAKARDLYQRASIYLARNGIACLCYDPVGQGERRQLLDEDGRPRFISGTTSGHQIMGVGRTLLGGSLAGTMIWDGMRALDYLQSRPDIDGEKLGCMGISGGGTNTSYIAALDDRVAAAAPGCYLTGFRSLVRTIGPQDIEQNLHNQLRDGLDHADYVLMRAPRPTLIMAATRDYFDIEGAWRLYREAKRAYGLLGWPERVDLNEADTEHTYSVQHCIAGARWFSRWFFGREPAIGERAVTPLPERELQCTPDGQVLRLPGARSLFDLNAAEEEALRPGREQLWRDRPAALEAVRRVTGITRFADLPAPRVEDRGSIRRDGYVIRKQVLTVVEGATLPALWFEPERSDISREPVLYLHGGGKHVDAAAGGAIERRVRSGERVLAVDLRGLGETGRTVNRPSLYTDLIGADSKEWSLAFLLGTSFVRLRTEDILACAKHLAALKSGGSQPIVVVRGDAAVPALHALALQPDAFRRMEIEGPIVSWKTTLRNPLAARQQQANAVFGGLRVYDLTDLVASVPAGKLTLAGGIQ